MFPLKTSPLLGQYKSCFHSKIDIVENAPGSKCD